MSELVEKLRIMRAHGHIWEASEQAFAHIKALEADLEKVVDPGYLSGTLLKIAWATNFHDALREYRMADRIDSLEAQLADSVPKEEAWDTLVKRSGELQNQLAMCRLGREVIGAALVAREEETADILADEIQRLRDDAELQDSALSTLEEENERLREEINRLMNKIEQSVQAAMIALSKEGVE